MYGAPAYAGLSKRDRKSQFAVNGNIVLLFENNRKTIKTIED